MHDDLGEFGQLDYHVAGEGAWRSRFAVTKLAVLSVGALGSRLADLIAALNLGPRPDVTIDRRLASLWFQSSVRPQGWSLPPLWDAIAGVYRAEDGWIRLHTNAPHHKSAALSVLECTPDREAVAQAVKRWSADALESRIIEAGGASAVMRNRGDWLAHPQGKAVAAEPLVHWSYHTGQFAEWTPTRERPLKGLRILDLTRVLAGPIATRALAGFGADVLRIDPPVWEEPNVVPDVTLGKRCGRLDLKSTDGLARFKKLLSRADILVHGYRPNALDAIISRQERIELAPCLIEVCLDAYGWSGPWARRRGFDSLVQMSCGIADAGSEWAQTEEPHPLPVQALDHATGYLMAASAVSALARALESGDIGNARLSLARTAELLFSLKPKAADEVTEPDDADFSETIEATHWGPMSRLRPAIDIAGTPMRWDLPASPLGSASAEWR